MKHNETIPGGTENPCVAGSVPAHTTQNQAATTKVGAAFVLIKHWSYSTKTTNLTNIINVA